MGRVPIHLNSRAGRGHAPTESGGPYGRREEVGRRAIVPSMPIATAAKSPRRATILPRPAANLTPERPPRRCHALEDPSTMNAAISVMFLALCAMAARIAVVEHQR